MPVDRGARIQALKQRYKERQLQRAERWSNWKAGVVEEMMTLQNQTREKLLTRFTDTKVMIELVTDRISETTLELKASVNSACSKASVMVDNVVEGFSSDVQKASDTMEEIGESIHAHGTVSAELTQNQVADLSDDIHENLNSLRRNFKDFSLHESFCDAIEPSEGYSDSEEVTGTLFTVVDDIDSEVLGDDNTVSSDLVSFDLKSLTL